MCIIFPIFVFFSLRRYTNFYFSLSSTYLSSFVFPEFFFPGSSFIFTTMLVFHIFNAPTFRLFFFTVFFFLFFLLFCYSRFFFFSLLLLMFFLLGSLQLTPRTNPTKEKYSLAFTYFYSHLLISILMSNVYFALILHSLYNPFLILVYCIRSYYCSLMYENNRKWS